MESRFDHRIKKSNNLGFPLPRQLVKFPTERSASLISAGRHDTAAIRMHDVSTCGARARGGVGSSDGRRCQAENERIRSVQRRPNGKSGLLPVQAS